MADSRDISVDELKLRRATSEAESALVKLGSVDSGVAVALSRLVQAVAEEAARTPRFAKSLAAALSADGEPTARLAAPRKKAPQKKAQRSKGLLDPFAVFELSGEAGLRARLSTLSVDQLKDIVAEHSMNYDKAAMRWKSAPKLVDRIVERVEARSTKGDILR